MTAVTATLTSIAAASSAPVNLPQSYLPKEERERLLRKGDMENLYVAEAVAACGSNDDGAINAAWAWLAKIKLPPTALRIIKAGQGAQFIKENGFDTSLADAEYGSGWLEDN